MCGVGGAARLGLPESRWDDVRTFVHGGERSLYELAFAASAAGYDVELRGYVSRIVYDEMAQLTGARPTVDLDLRAPTADDVVIIPEGWAEPERFVGVVGSPARVVLIQLAPIGLFGWVFDDAQPPALDRAQAGPGGNVNTDREVATALALGFELWSNSRSLADEQAARGFACTWIGSGSPEAALPTATERPFDVAIIGGNRWEPRNARVIEALEGPVLVTEPGSNGEILRQLSSAKLLVHLARTEGHSRLGIEARRVGTVPVMDRANPYLAGGRAEDGLVLVGSEDEAVEACRRLLADPARLAELSTAGRAFAEGFVDWPSYVQRVGDALANRPTPVGPRPLTGLSAMVEEQRDIVRGDERCHAEVRLQAVRDEHALRVAEAQVAHDRQVHDLETALASTTADLVGERAARAATTVELEQAQAELEAIRATISWRIRNTVVALPGTDQLRRLRR